MKCFEKLVENRRAAYYAATAHCRAAYASSRAVARGDDAAFAEIEIDDAISARRFPLGADPARARRAIRALVASSSASAEARDAFRVYRRAAVAAPAARRARAMGAPDPSPGSVYGPGPVPWSLPGAYG